MSIQEEGYTMTDFLFSQPSVLSGVASIIDLYGVSNDFNTSRTEEEADMMALRSDWITIGKDIRSAMDTIDNEQ